MRVELYAGNLHHGGAVAVAASFFDQLPLLWGTETTAWIDHLTVVASPRVLSDMRNLGAIKILDRVKVVVSEDRPRFGTVRMHPPSYDVRFTVFGPAYEGRRAHVEVMGFADGSILPAHQDVGPDKIGRPSVITNLLSYLKQRRKFALMKKNDVYVVQTANMADALGKVVSSRRIHIVPNIVPAVFHNRNLYRTFTPIERLPDEVRLFYPARGYPHKNHAFIPSVCDAFEKMFGVPLSVVVTLRQDEMVTLNLTLDDRIINVGEVSVFDCPALYEATDGLFFPSLNETASSSPMEALFMGKPVIAVDLPFMREMTNGFGYFYSPADSVSAAEAIHRAVTSVGSESLENLQGIAWARGLLDPVTQAQEYLSILHDAADCGLVNGY